MKFLTLCDWTGILETELFAQSYRSDGLAARDHTSYPARVMQASLSLDEQADKVVGRRAAPASAYDRLMRNAAAIMPRLPFPKGVFRFGTSEEANAWTNEHILEGALRKARARQARTTWPGCARS